MMPILSAADPIEHVVPHHMFWLGPISVTNQMVMAVVAAILMLMIFPTLSRKAQTEAPTGAKNFFEAILEFLRVEVFRPALKEHTDRFLPYLWTLFFFMLFCNLLGQLPIGELLFAITGNERFEHFSGTATGSLATTIVLAASAFVFIHIN